MTDREFKDAADAMVEVCKDLLMVDMPAMVKRFDAAAQGGPVNGAMFWCRTPEKYSAMRRTAVALLAAHGEADALRKVFVDEEMKRRREIEKEWPKT